MRRFERHVWCLALLAIVVPLEFPGCRLMQGLESWRMERKALAAATRDADADAAAGNYRVKMIGHCLRDFDCERQLRERFGISFESSGCSVTEYEVRYTRHYNKRIRGPIDDRLRAEGINESLEDLYERWSAAAQAVREASAEARSETAERDRSTLGEP